MTQTQFEEQEYTSSSLDSSLWKRIFSLMGPNKKYLYGMMILNMVIAILDVAFPYMEKIAIDYFVTQAFGQNELLVFSGVFVAGILLQTFLVFKLFDNAGKLEMGFSYDVRNKVFERLQTLSFSYYDKTPIGWLLARVTSDIARVSEILAWSLMDVAWGVAVMVGAGVVMLVTNWKLALLVLIFTPLLAYVCYWFQIRILKNYRKVRKINSRITSGFNEGISGAKTTKTLVIEESNFKGFDEDTTSMRRSSIHAATLSSIFMPLIMGIGAVSSALLLWRGGNLVLSQVIQFGTLMMFTQYASQFYEPLKQIASLIAEMQMAQASGERVLSLLDSQPTVIDKPEVIEKYGTEIAPHKENWEPMQGSIAFKHVNFSYIPDEPVLKDFNLEVQEGQTIALVGETGSGKSTVVNLLCRFYEPTSGVIEMDGRDLRDRSLGWLHSNLGYVLQTPHLFSGSVKDNVRFGKPDATDEEVIEACKLVDAHHFIMKMEKGYDSDVGEGGNLLSTGQKQLLSFARAIIGNPKLFVLDEATSSIDTETEQVIQHTIEKVLQGRTSFIIAHRLSTIVNADKILVVRKGLIEEQGTHEELLKLKGYYYRLYTNQFQSALQAQIMGQGKPNANLASE